MNKLSHFSKFCGLAVGIAFTSLFSCSDPSKPTDVAVVSDSPAITKQDSLQEFKKSVKPGDITVIGLEQLFGLKQSGQVLLVDCRGTLFYRMGHIDGAINLPVKDLNGKWTKIKPQLDAAVKANQILVFYCQNKKCPYAYQAAKKLSAEGYGSTIYEGGWEQWKAIGL